MIQKANEGDMRITLEVWRQAGPGAPGEFETHDVIANEHMSFLEMMDVLNTQLVESGKEPFAFESDCREGICGSCSLTIDGQPHGPRERTTACQLHMRTYQNGDRIQVEPWRADAFPVLKDLMTDRAAFDKIQRAGGYVSVNTGAAPDAHAIPVPKENADLAFEAAACIGCGACVAACPNASAMLFTSAKVSQLALLPQGAPERERRVLAMVDAMDEEGFGNCSNHYECEAACPKGISVENIARLNREYARATIKGR
ncbi:MAG: succinate dehydrogenase / fumarate reductase iron-sulfur subunit [Planctomycetota bacterium]|jgi:succinate dehydrogenase / fumarate reductase iron-sulfur subunit